MSVEELMADGADLFRGYNYVKCSVGCPAVTETGDLRIVAGKDKTLTSWHAQGAVVDAYKLT